MAMSNRRNWRKAPADPKLIDLLRRISVPDVATALGLYCKRDISYRSQIHLKSECYHIGVGSAVFQIVVTGQKWFSCSYGVGGGGAIDLTMHLFGESFQAALLRLEKAHLAFGAGLPEPEVDQETLDHRAWIARLQDAHLKPVAAKQPGICQSCSGQSIPYGKFCTRCYGGILHPEGKPIEPGMNDGIYKEFNAEVNAGIYDAKMPPSNWVADIILGNRPRWAG